MDNRKGQSKVNLCGKVLQAKRMLRTKASLNTSENPFFLRPFFESLEHLFLHINTNDFSVFPYHLSKGDTEKPHSTSNIQNRHPFLDIWG